MHKYVFTLRSEPDGELYLDGWADATPLVNFKSQAEYKKALVVMQRMGMETDEVAAALINVNGLLGFAGDIRRRLNMTITGPYAVEWQEEEPLSPDDLAKYINKLPLDQRKAFLQGAEI
ncbi:MAG: hypothetical protein HXX17_08030 [Geobacteraceae bacterium]|nr:hypothetical protein [Geobacteraceae bacterium]